MIACIENMRKIIFHQLKCLLIYFVLISTPNARIVLKYSEWLCLFPMNADMQLIIKQKCIASQYICNNVSSGFANFCKYFATFACLAFGDFYCIHCKQLHMYYAYSRVGKYYLFLKCKMKMLLALTLWYFGG